MELDSHVFIDRMRLHAYHGVMEQERNVGADFEVSLRVHCDFKKAMETDNIACTVSYADLYRVVSEQMLQPSKLLEHVAGRIANAVMQLSPLVTGLWLRITKINPPMGADCDGAGIEIQIGS